MTEYNEGDLVEAVKGESVIRGYLDSYRDIVTENVTHTPHFLAECGWTLTVIERATPPLPTEPGWYMARYGEPNYTILQLCFDTDCRESASGPHWYHPKQDRVLSTEDLTDHYLPLTRLEPVPVTHARILPSLEEIARCISPRPEGSKASAVSTTDVMEGRRILANLIAEFGVTEP